MFNNDDPETNGEKWFYETIKDEISVIFDVGCRTDTLFYDFKGEVHFFDPVVDFITQLKKNYIFKNSSSFFNTVGLGNDSIETYYYPRYQSFCNRLESCKVDDSPNKIKLQIIKAEDYINTNNVKNVDFLKIDTEGYELEVLKGFENYLQNIKYIQFEYGGTYLDKNIKLIDVIDCLRKQGFCFFYYLSNNNLIPINNYSDHYNYCNIVCMKVQWNS